MLKDLLLNMRSYHRQIEHEPEIWEDREDFCFLCGFSLDHELHEI